MKKNIFLMLFVLLLGKAQAQTDVLIEAKVDSILKLMTLDEKIGQTVLFTSDWAVTGPTMRSGYLEDVKKGRVGSIFNAYTAEFTRSLQKMALEETRLKIPLLFGYDVIHGFKTIFPIPLGESASWDMAAIESSARVAAEEASAAGLHWTYAPMVDIARDPRWGRVSEGAGEDTWLGKQIGAARVIGFQGKDLSANNTILACVKHYAAYGAAQAGRDYHTVDMSDRVLRETYLPPYKAAIDAGALSVMTSFNELDGVPATGNSYLLTDILRNEWKFNGFVVTDYTSINEMVNHGVVGNEKDAAALAMNAGVDMDMQGAVFLNHLKALIEEGKVSMHQLDRAVRNVLKLKYKLGLFSDPYRYCDAQREKAVILSEANQQKARDVARKSIVLLKNEGQILPLQKSIKNIALIGPLADNTNDLIGNWSAAGEGKHAVSVLTGLKNKLGASANISYAKGCEIEGNDTKGFAAALALAKKADVILLAIGESAGMSGEAASRSQIGLPGVQQQLADALIATGKPVVVILMNGRPLAISSLAEKATGILETWFLGTQAGNAIADVLMGDYNPSGKLTMTFPRNAGQIPIHYNMKNTGRPMQAENKYTSKYLDVSNTPLYPFGYGLSYTQFTYGELQLSAPTMTPRGKITASIEVSNTGNYDGEEVVQLYIRDLVGSVTRPVKELKGFEKIMLKKGEKRTISFTIDNESLSFYRKDMSWGSEAGEFDVFVGTNSQEVKSARFRLLE